LRVLLPWLRGHRHLTENQDQRSRTDAKPGPCQQFTTPDCKKIYMAPRVRVIVFCSVHRLIWQDSDKSVDLALTSPDYHIIILRLSLAPLCNFKKVIACKKYNLNVVRNYFYQVQFKN